MVRRAPDRRCQQQMRRPLAWHGLHSRIIFAVVFLLGTHSLAVARLCHVKYFNVTRFSIEWSKVEPQQGRFDQVQT